MAYLDYACCSMPAPPWTAHHPGMSYQYLFCATCGQRRTGHAFRCSVCDGLLRRPEPQRSVTVVQLRPVVRHSDSIKRQPVAA
jgi:hypothetical protein